MSMMERIAKRTLKKIYRATRGVWPLSMEDDSSLNNCSVGHEQEHLGQKEDTDSHHRVAAPLDFLI